MKREIDPRLRFLAEGDVTSPDATRILTRSATLSSDLQASLSKRLCVRDSNKLGEWQQPPAVWLENALVQLREATEWERSALLIHHTIRAAPDLVFPLGFDEVRLADEAREIGPLSIDARGVMSELLDEFWSPLNADICEDCKALINTLLVGGAEYRHLGGAWFSELAVIDPLVPQIFSKNMLEYVSGMMANWTAGLRGLTTPLRTTVTYPELSVMKLAEPPPVEVGTKTILDQLSQNQVTLSELHWRTLEEIVAELLKGLGLVVDVTPRSADGGRDIIARGELIPGEPTVLAVEVKQTPLVKIGQLRAALYANRHYPALLIATSGRFSAGVFRERNADDNRLRLLLKDGMALAQWIDSYTASRFTPKL